jgi:hypothetical protein
MTLDTDTAKVATGQSQPIILTPSVPVGSLSNSDLPSAKKRGRPSKVEMERRQAEAIAKGEIFPPAVEPQPYAENSSQPTDVISQIQTPPTTSLKRNRTLTGEAEDDGRARPFPQPVEKGQTSSTFGSPEPDSIRNMSHPERMSMPIQHLSPANPGSPLRNSTLASDIEATSPSKNRPTPDSYRVQILRVRGPIIS